MNGFNKIVLYSLLLFTSCSNKNLLKEYEGEGLFLIYRGVPQKNINNIQIWANPQAYLTSNKNISLSAQQLISVFEPHHMVLLFGVFNISQEYYIEKITYQKNGQQLLISLYSSESTMHASDIGYPVFIKNKNITQIFITMDNKPIYITNINFLPLK